MSFPYEDKTKRKTLKHEKQGGNWIKIGKKTSLYKNSEEEQSSEKKYYYKKIK